MFRSRTFLVAGLALASMLAGCSTPGHRSGSAAGDAHDAATVAQQSFMSRYAPGGDAGARRLYGAPVRVGNGVVRTYVTLDGAMPGLPLEVGVAMSEGAMDSLPAAKHLSHEQVQAGVHDMHRFDLELPPDNPTPFRFVEFGWNPAGHEPPGVWDHPHFDFHFYTVPAGVRDAILPSDPQFAAKAARYPEASLRPEFYLDAAAAARITPAQATVPQMGVHWIDVRTPEVQKMAGHPERYAPFTRTYIRGTWDGQFIFEEPMITRAHLLARRAATEASAQDEVIPVSTPARYATAGFYPRAYRIQWDAAAREYRVALTQLTWRD